MRTPRLLLVLATVTLLPGCLATLAKAPIDAAVWTVGASYDVTKAVVTTAGDLIIGDDAPSAPAPEEGPPACVT